jgi:hypothetical protein
MLPPKELAVIMAMILLPLLMVMLTHLFAIKDSL